MCSSDLDLHAVEDVLLEPGTPRLVPTGLTIEVPPGYEAQVRPRSQVSVLPRHYRAAFVVALLALDRSALLQRAPTFAALPPLLRLLL